MEILPEARAIELEWNSGHLFLEDQISCRGDRGLSTTPFYEPQSVSQSANSWTPISSVLKQ